MQVTAKHLIEHINKYYDMDEVLVTTIYSHADLYDVDPEKSYELWVSDMADVVESAMEYAQEVINDTITEHLPEEEQDETNN